MSKYGKMWLFLFSPSKCDYFCHLFPRKKATVQFTLFEGSSTCLLFLGEKLCNVNTFKKNIVTNSMIFGKNKIIKIRGFFFFLGAKFGEIYFLDDWHLHYNTNWEIFLSFNREIFFCKILKIFFKKSVKLINLSDLEKLANSWYHKTGEI